MTSQDVLDIIEDIVCAVPDKEVPISASSNGLATVVSLKEVLWQSEYAADVGTYATPEELKELLLKRLEDFSNFLKETVEKTRKLENEEKS